MNSENPFGADNQQERPSLESDIASKNKSDELRVAGILRGHTQSSFVKQKDEEMVHALQRCGGGRQNYNRPKVAKFLVG
jgi:hypothetical protein